MAASCGDGVIHVGQEACDDGNDVQDDGCDNACQVGFCGNGRLEDGEACDDGNDDNEDDCVADCVDAFCGDGHVHVGVEECDDGNENAMMSCTNACESWRLEGVQQLAIGQVHSCMLSRAGEVFCWGAGRGGQIGDGAQRDRSLPTRVPILPEVVEVAAFGGADHTCARNEMGQVWCWGYNKIICIKPSIIFW